MRMRRWTEFRCRFVNGAAQGQGTLQELQRPEKTPPPPSAAAAAAAAVLGVEAHGSDALPSSSTSSFSPSEVVAIERGEYWGGEKVGKHMFENFRLAGKSRGGVPTANNALRLDRVDGGSGLVSLHLNTYRARGTTKQQPSASLGPETAAATMRSGIELEKEGEREEEEEEGKREETRAGVALSAARKEKETASQRSDDEPASELKRSHPKSLRLRKREPTSPDSPPVATTSEGKLRRSAAL